MRLFKKARKPRKETTAPKAVQVAPVVPERTKPTPVAVRVTRPDLRRSVPVGIGGLGGVALGLALLLTAGQAWGQPGLVPPARATQAEVNAGTDNRKYVTPLTMANFVGGLGGATNGIAMLNGFGTNTTIYDGIFSTPTLGSPILTNPVFIAEDVGTLYSYSDNIWYGNAGDGAGLASVDFNSRTLHDTLGDATLNWLDQTLIGSWKVYVGGQSYVLFPFFYTNTAAAASISNNFSVKVANLGVGTGNLTWDSGNNVGSPTGLLMNGNNDTMLWRGTPFSVAGSNEYGSFMFALSNTAWASASMPFYFSNSIYLGGTNPIIGIGSNLVVQGGILSGTATGGGGGGTNSFFEEDAPDLWGDPVLSLTNYQVLFKGVDRNYRLFFGSTSDDDNLVGWWSTDGEMYLVHSNNSLGLRTTFTWNDNNWTRHVSHLPLVVQGDFAVESGDATFYQSVSIEGDLTVNGTASYDSASIGDLTVTNLYGLFTSLTNAAGETISEVITNTHNALGGGGGGTNAAPQWLSFTGETNVYVNAGTPTGCVQGGPLHFRLLLSTNAYFKVPTNAPDGQVIKVELVQNGTGGFVTDFEAGWNFGDLVDFTPTATANKRSWFGATFNSSSNLWDVLSVGTGY